MISAEVWQANLGRGVSLVVFLWNLTRIMAAAGLGGIVAFQEIDEADEPDERAELLDALDGTHRLYLSRELNPIAVPVGVDVIEDGRAFGCEGLARVTPARWITYVVCQMGEGLTLAVVNFHLPRNLPSTAVRRIRMRLALRRLVRRLRRAGHVVYLAGDTNTRGRFAHWTVPLRKAVTGTIDRSWITSPRRHPWRLVRLATMRLRVTIDGHDAHGAKLGWRRR